MIPNIFINLKIDIEGILTQQSATLVSIFFHHKVMLVNTEEMLMEVIVI